MGNMFCDKITWDSIAGNVTKGICDHLIQFLTEPSTFSKDNEKRSTTYRRCKHFSKENFTNEINNINWEEVSEWRELFHGLFSPYCYRSTRQAHTY